MKKEKRLRKSSRTEKHDEINVYNPKRALYHGSSVRQDGGLMIETIPRWPLNP